MGDIATVILAAGQGRRMKSALPKVLHRVLGLPLVAFPLALARAVKSARTVVVVGHGREQVEAAVRSVPGGEDARFAVQREQRGTGHAALSALPALAGHRGPVLILSGDVPLLKPQTLERLGRARSKSCSPLAFVTFRPANPAGYGRVLRQDDRVVALREHRDCSRAERAIGEVNAGIYLVDIGFLRRCLKRLSDDNEQGELYLTDLVAMAAAGRRPAVTVEALADEVGGVNDRAELARVEELLRELRNLELMRAGVTIRQPGTVRVELDAEIGADTELGPFVQILGRTRIGRGCAVEAGAVIADSTLADGARVLAHSVIEGAVVGAGAAVGPMARLRPGSVLGPAVRVGNFVEVKNTVMGEGSKANHLAYLGDGAIGRRVNVGAGTIFCNYDGFAKHRTVLEDDVFIGSDSQLVAPVTVGAGAYVASGSTVTKDVPADALAISRAPQQNRLKVAAVLRRTLSARKKKADAGKAGGEDPR
ncbi:MAG TPA: bifunctional UDP-N-acetylglucosamine diphosphorylase/glucosamine-1-phosphate N-acetyltransferase GlmU [Polyangia bacterium]|nr:bifunctional UDP-N-acetylglucosamine diphosphorylase/glucosamine-1-phosphate N-acetyltransferase GlmU [Polyangia bacterium]